MSDCCRNNPKQNKGFWSGIAYGLIPHTFCIAFFVLSIAGAAGGAAVAKKFLMIPHFFLFLTIVSILFATLAAFLYLRRSGCCDAGGIKKKKGYILSLYSATILMNILVAYVIMPLSISRQTATAAAAGTRMSQIDISVQIPCPGHAPLVIDEVKKLPGVETVDFKMPRTFEITYDPEKTSQKEIAALDIFKTFKLETANNIAN